MPEGSRSANQHASSASIGDGDTQTDQCPKHFKIASSRLRKRCLFLLVLGLMIMMIVNLALTLWMLKVMEFSSAGLGNLRVVPGGLHLTGKAYVMGPLTASSIRSKPGQPLTVESTTNFTINTRDANGMLKNRMYLGDDKLEVWASSFIVMDHRGVPLFSANPKEVIVGSDTLHAAGEGGAHFTGSIQTPAVKSEPGHNLRLESSTRSIEIRSPKGVIIESRASDLKFESLSDLAIHSVAGKIRLESPDVRIPNIRTATPSQPTSHRRQEDDRTGGRWHQVYQLCACANGRLFLAQPHGLCAARDDSDRICR
ncbi:delta-sarcoglycan-like [Ctenocephalides felis]|uniref:delta-sarcoglycan-like n=1 Tax=Ctenocephalides felis TaxID=7515 RepID=UPI000E6E4578|nr:delta-sarcoglycan-like [Ctenocephalides felis]